MVHPIVAVVQKSAGVVVRDATIDFAVDKGVKAIDRGVTLILTPKRTVKRRKKVFR